MRKSLKICMGHAPVALILDPPVSIDDAFFFHGHQPEKMLN